MKLKKNRKKENWKVQTLCPTRPLRREDFPTFGWPEINVIQEPVKDFTSTATNASNTPLSTTFHKARLMLHAGLQTASSLNYSPKRRACTRNLKARTSDVGEVLLPLASPRERKIVRCNDSFLFVCLFVCLFFICRGLFLSRR